MDKARNREEMIAVLQDHLDYRLRELERVKAAYVRKRGTGLEAFME